MGIQPVRIFAGINDANGDFIPLNVDANGNLGINMEGELAVGELKLAAADQGLVALLAGLVGPVGASSKNFTYLYTLSTSGSGFKIQVSISVSSVPTDSTLATALIGTNSKTFSDVVTAIGALPQTQFNGAVTNTGLTDITNVYDSLTHALTVSTKGVRNTAGATANHRANLTYPDLAGPTTLAATNIPNSQIAPTAPTFADTTAAPSSALTAVAYYGAFVVRNNFGVSMASSVATVTPTSGHMVRLTIPSAWQIDPTTNDQDVYYDIFMSTDAGAPKHVATFTAAQLKVSGNAGSGCYVITAETPVTNSTARAAYAVDIGVVGAGMQTNAGPFNISTALEVNPGGTAITPVSTAGYNNVDVFVDCAITSLGQATVPTLTLIPLFLNDSVSQQYHVGAPIFVNIEGGVGQAKRQVFNLTTNGASVMILVANIANVTVNRIDITPTSVV